MSKVLYLKIHEKDVGPMFMEDAIQWCTMWAIHHNPFIIHNHQNMLQRITNIYSGSTSVAHCLYYAMPYYVLYTTKGIGAPM